METERTAMLEDCLTDIKVLPLVVIDNASAAVTLARALVRGGLRSMEIAFRTAAAADAIGAVVAARLPILVGAGTLLHPADVERARAAGAQFGVSPGATPALREAVAAAQLPWLPGASTASEAMALAEQGFRLLKLFPASLALLDAFAGPLPDVRWVATGGVDESNMRSYLQRANVAAVSGTWIAPRALIASGAFDEIERRAAEAVRLAVVARDCL